MTNTPSFSVAGKTVLITGGSGGIGGAFAKAFLDHGASVIVADLVMPKGTIDQRIRYEILDVREDAGVEDLAGRVGTLDVVIHCAGRLVRWEEYRPEVFKEIIDIHLVGNLRLANAFRPHLKATKGCLINIGSMYSFFGAPQVPAYAAAKTAIVSLTKSLAISFAADGIRVNAIAPGWIKTEISRGGRENPEFNAKVVARIPGGEWAEPEDLAGTAIFLASAASSLINGVTIPVDGGYLAS
ncbi:SDR family NAD(P)-dependent oxidoreductase [Labrys wisconsinensis]|uniref:NAD(P)-dependent dehydrogenase (Short-subunit alcohol dehydrogenase family) n=1 Tax=Labrys wisconsinensis TaxID=425677 RepID=A0ABU0J4S7_9HYPH|nr:SDR family oxidoreductase [Labrys wisconsinensis]MDQ0469263.1 NAD(P)-dependent dehydrogenase (short-subunit alcohol dehydrogenase family) [Labrys wisconsinensis]